MNYIALPQSIKIIAKTILTLAIILLNLGIGRINTVQAAPAADQDSCGQLLADAEARFRSTLAPDGSVPATPETQAAAQEYIRISKMCYEEIEAQNAGADLLDEPPSFIDDGGMFVDNESFGEFVFPGNKWGTNTPGTPGGTVTYSFMGNGTSLSAENQSYGDNVAITSLPGFQACFITDIQAALAAWQAVANIQFVQVSDSGSGFNTAGANGDIRIGAHYFDGPTRTLAHAYYPPPNGTSAAGDMHFDKSENWTCNTGGIDIGVVAMHEIGHTLGLDHENTNAIVAVMDPYYNVKLASLQSDDINGAAAIYGIAQLADPPSNDTIGNPLSFNTAPYSSSVDTTGANQAPDPNDPTVNVACDERQLNKGDNSVWYKYGPGPNVTFYLDTLGSSYDTYIAVWTGTPDSLSFVACDDDTPNNLQSQLVLNAQANTSYYIQVAGYTGTQGDAVKDNPGGNLNFHVATFGDVPSNYWAWRYIEGLNGAGVTSGCSTSPKNYCPSFTVTRDQMAVFLLKGKHGSGYAPPAVGGTTGFSDVPTNHWAAAWIKQLAAEGITGGCGGGKYCPGAPVARDQMAIFLLKAKHGSSYSPPPPTGVFLDVPTNYWAAAWIERLAAENITGGCGNGNYCPTTPVTRDQMAVFLTRTFNLPPLP